ncbi:MAG: hypothetical protein AB1656_00095 [Candidatus Omnitrophota bacterium]
MNRLFPRVSRLGLIFSCMMGIWLALNASTDACDIPVFRYALELWPAGIFDVYAIRQKPLTPQEQDIAAWLETHAEGSAHGSHYRFHLVDSKDSANPSAKQDDSNTAPPRLEVYYPQEMGHREPFWQVPLTEENAKALTDSPIRRTIARRLLNGDAAVWIILESGDANRDEKAARTLQEVLLKMEKTLQWPTLEPDGKSQSLELDDGDRRIRFAIVRLRRSDEAETFLTQMLLHTEADLMEYAAETMAFPIYGRGIALYSLIGEGINEDTIREACEFLAGPCTCFIKDQNPGADLLVAADWDAALEGRMASEREMSRYLGIPAMIVNSATSNDSSGDNAVTRRFRRNIALSLGMLLAANLLLGILFLYRKRKRR